MRGIRVSNLPIYLSIAFVVLFVTPLFYLVYGIGFFKPAPVNINIFATIASLAEISLVYGFSSGFIAASMAILYVWLVIRTDLPAKRLFELLPLLALTIPHLVKIFGWVLLLSPQIGMVNILLERVFRIGPVFDIFNLPGMIFVQGFDALPIAVLIFSPAVKAMDHALEEASQICGNTVRKTFFSVTLPILLPPFLSGFILLSIMSSNLLEAPFILGQGHINTFATTLFFYVQELVQPDYGTATKLALANVFMTVALFSLYIYSTRRAYKYVTVTGKEAAQTVHFLKRRSKLLAGAFCTFILLTVFILPMIVLTYVSLIDYGGLTNPRYGFGNYISVFNLDLFRSAFTNSMIIGVTVSLLTTFLTVFMAYAAFKGRYRGSRIFELIANTPLAFPGIVYGFALFITFLIAPGLNIIYGTIYPLILAVTIVYTPTAFRIISGSLVQLSNDLEDAARVTGASWSRAFTRVTLPNLRRGIFSSVYRAFLDGLRELGPVILLATPTSTVLVALLFGMYSAGGGTFNILATGSVVLTLTASVFLVFFKLIERRWFS